MRTPSSITCNEFSDFSLAEGTHHASSAATITRPSARPRPTSFMRTTSAATRAQRHTNNGKTWWNAKYRQSYQTSPQQSTAKTSCALTHGPTPSLTGRVFITLFPTQYYTRHRLGSSTRHLWSTLTTNIGSFSATSYAFHCKTTNASGNSTSSDIGFYVGDEDSVKGGSVIYMPYNHNFLTRGNGHRVLISDIQLLQWYSKRRDIRHNPLPYSIVHNAVMDLLSNKETPAAAKTPRSS